MLKPLYRGAPGETGFDVLPHPRGCERYWGEVVIPGVPDEPDRVVYSNRGNSSTILPGKKGTPDRVVPIGAMAGPTSNAAAATRSGAVLEVRVGNRWRAVPHSYREHPDKVSGQERLTWVDDVAGDRLGHAEDRIRHALVGDRRLDRCTLVPLAWSDPVPEHVTARGVVPAVPSHPTRVKVIPDQGKVETFEWEALVHQVATGRLQP